MTYVDPFLKQGFDGDRIRCGGCLGGLLILGSVGAAVPLLFVPIWIDVPSEALLRWKPLPGRPAPLVTATLFHFDFKKPQWTGSSEHVPGFHWLDFCASSVNDTMATAEKLVEGTIFQAEPFKVDPQVCLGATAACWLSVVGVLSIAGADLFILLAGVTKSILMLLFGGWLALLSACAQLLSLAGLFLVDAKHLGTAQGVILLATSVAMSSIGTLMALYQAMRATPDRLPKERPKWKEDDEELTEEEEKRRVQAILVEDLDYDIPRLERYRVAMDILLECETEEISYEEWIIEERLRMKTEKGRRAILTEEELKRATVELRIRRRDHPALAQAIAVMMEEASKGRAAGRVPVALLEEAFQGVDVQLRNRITIRELLAALRVCGIYVEHAAAEQMIDWLRKQEQRQGGDLGIDLPRFINLFNHVTDMLAKEAIFRKASRGYQLTCRLAFVLNLAFLCVVLFSVTRPNADEGWDNLLNVFGVLFAIQFTAVIAMPMLCNVVGRKARVWRQHFCNQLMACLAPVFRCCNVLARRLCRCVLYFAGCCGLCRFCCPLPEWDEEIGGEAVTHAHSRRRSLEVGRRRSMDSGRHGSKGRRGSSGGRRGSMEFGSRGSSKERRASMEMGSQRSSKEGRRRGSTELGSERGSKESREGGPKGSKEFSRRSSKEPSVAELERRGSTDTARGSAGSEGRGSDPGGSRRNSAQSAHSYTLGSDLDVTELDAPAAPAYDSEESGLSITLGSEEPNLLEQMQRFRLERKQVRTPTEGLRSAGLAFKSEDEVISYPVGGRRRKPPEIITTEPEEQAFPEAWAKPVKKKRKRPGRGKRHAHKTGQRGSFFRSFLGSKEELSVVKELSVNSIESSAGTPNSGPSRRNSLSSRGSGSSRKGSKASKGSKLAFLGRMLSRRRSVEEPQGYDPRGYDLAAQRASGASNVVSFSPMQVRNLRAPDLLPSELEMDPASWTWNMVSASKTTMSSRTETKDMKQEDVP